MTELSAEKLADLREITASGESGAFVSAAAVNGLITRAAA